MFTKWLVKYSLDTKDYSKEIKLINKDINYLLMHYYRTRLNTTCDILIVIPTSEDEAVNLIKDLYSKSLIDWWENLNKFLPVIDIVKAFMHDLWLKQTGTRNVIIADAKEFETELQTISNVNLKKYIDDFVTNPIEAADIKNKWEVS